MWNVSFLMMNVVETSGALVFWISVDGDCDGMESGRLSGRREPERWR